MANKLITLLNKAFRGQVENVASGVYGSFEIQKDKEGLVAIFRVDRNNGGSGARYRAEALPELARSMEAQGLDTSLVEQARSAMGAGLTTAELSAPAALKKLDFSSCYEVKEVTGELTCFFQTGYIMGKPLPSYIHGSNAGAPPIRAKDLAARIEEYKSKGYETWQLEGALRMVERKTAPVSSQTKTVNDEPPTKDGGLGWLPGRVRHTFLPGLDI